MTKKECADNVGGLSTPSKMPGKAFGFSASKCITGSKLREVPGSVCANCYACKGNYVFQNVKLAHERRFAALQAALHGSRIERQRWIRSMVTLISSEQWFRWHDSGDIQSVDHLMLIAEVARKTPDCHHWLPTREYRMVQGYLEFNKPPENLTIRLSAHIVNQLMAHPTLPTSAVYVGAPPAGTWKCPARQQDNECKECRACWDPGVKTVVYENH